VKESVVTDSACLIGLEGIDRLDLLPGVFGPVLAPPAVIREFGIRPKWLEARDIGETTILAALRTVVDNGEAEAIALASEYKLRVILDDRQARAAARNLSIPFTGTIGLLLKAREIGLIEQIKPLLDDLARNDFHLADSLRREALRLAGEL
jgi:predicted nucleic acid-binding protein